MKLVAFSFHATPFFLAAVPFPASATVFPLPDSTAEAEEAISLSLPAAAIKKPADMVKQPATLGKMQSQQTQDWTLHTKACGLPATNRDIHENYSLIDRITPLTRPPDRHNSYPF